MFCKLKLSFVDHSFREIQTRAIVSFERFFFECAVIFVNYKKKERKKDRSNWISGGENFWCKINGFAAQYKLKKRRKK